MKCSTCFCLINLSKLPCLIARTIPTSIDLIIGLPTIRKYDLVLKLPSHFSNNKTDSFAEILTSCIPAGVNLFGTGNGPSGSVNPPSTIKLGRNLTRLRNLTLGRKLTLGRNLTTSRKLTLKIHQQFRVKTALLTALHSHKVMRNRRRANGLSMTRCYGLESCVKLRMLSESR
jgi:hypothetical protein